MWAKKFETIFEKIMTAIMSDLWFTFESIFAFAAPLKLNAAYNRESTVGQITLGASQVRLGFVALETNQEYKMKHPYFCKM